MIGAVDMNAKWGWYNALYVIGKEWFMSPSEVSDRHFKEVLTALAYLKDKKYE